MRLGRDWSDICIRNISSRGLLVSAARPLRRGEFVEIRRGPHVIVAQVRWSSGAEFGVHTQERLDVEALAAEPDKSGVNFQQQRAREPGFERRARPRQRVNESEQRSRHVARLLEASSLAAAGVAMVLATGWLVFDTVSAPLRTITSALP